MRAYAGHGASFARKSLQGWIPPSGSADDDITYNLHTLRSRSRDLYMGSPLAAGAIKTIRTNVVGSGLMVNSHVDREVLGLTEEEAEEWERATEREWLLWSNSPACDASHMSTFYQLQALVLMSALMSGDTFVGLPWIKRRGDVYSLKLYLIEGDRVCDPQDNSAPYMGRDILGGVEVGVYGEPIAYWVSRYHPYNIVGRHNRPQKWTRVSAFGTASGRRQILHIMPDVERPGQRRGVPLLATVLEAMKQLERYTDAELMAAVVSGLFTVFVTSDDGEGLGGGLLEELDGSTGDALSMGNGTVVELDSGKSISTATPGRPNSNFGGFVESICRQIGAALELPYELLIKNFTASYSASRASLLEAWKSFRMRRQWLIDSFCQPVYEEWLAEAVSIGRISAPGFFDDPIRRLAWSRAEWSGDAQGQLDPQKEAQAAILRIQNGLSTREREAAELTGMPVQTIMQQLGKEQRMAEDAGATINQPQVQTAQPAAAAAVDEDTQGAEI